MILAAVIVPNFVMLAAKKFLSFLYIEINLLAKCVNKNEGIKEVI